MFDSVTLKFERLTLQERYDIKKVLTSRRTLLFNRQFLSCLIDKNVHKTRFQGFLSQHIYV